MITKSFYTLLLLLPCAYLMGQTELTILEIPADTTISCEDDISPSSLGEITASTTCTGEVTVTYADESDADDCLETITRTFTATDDCGNSATAVQTIFIEDTTAPVFEGWIEVDVPCHEVDSPLVVVSDNCSDEIDLTYIYDVMGVSCPWRHVRNYTAIDECGNESTFFQVLSITDNVAPVFTLFPEDVIVDCNNIPDVEADIAFSDNCSYDVELSFDGEEVIGEGCEYQLERTYTTTDVCGNSTSAIWTITVVDTIAPVFTSVPEDLEIDCGEEIPVTEATAEDGCGEVSITYEDAEAEEGCGIIRTFTATDECGNSSSAIQTISFLDTTAPEFTSVPEDLEIECGEEIPETGATAEDNCGEVTVTFSDDITEGNCTITRTFVATDECGNTATAVQTISIIEDTTPPVIEGEVEVFWPCDEQFEIPVMVTVSDNCSEDVDLSWYDNFVSAGCAGTIARGYTAVDACGNTSNFGQVIRLTDDVEPTFDIFPEDLTIECGQIPSNDTIEIEHGDNCTWTTLEYSGEEIIDGDCPQSYTIERTWTLTDECWNSTSATWTITVVDTTAPVFTSVPEDLEIECGEEIPETVATAEDGCGEVSVTYADESDFGDCLETITRTFTATDECGNSATAVQTIFIEDTTAPEIVGEIEVEWPCDEEFPATVNVSDNCSEEVDLSWVDYDIDAGCAGRFIRDFTAIDECGNSSTFQQIVTLIDEEAPIFTQFPEDVTVDCNNIPGVEAEIEFSDNCSNDVELSFDGEEVIGEGCEYQLERTYTITDVCGNSTSAVWTITVVDTIAPVFTSIPEDLEIDCGEEIPVTEATAEDGCGEVSITYEDAEAEEGCGIIRTFTATDECGNSSSAIQTISFLDTTAPEFTSIPEDLEIECGEEIPESEATAEDNCGEVTITFSDDFTEGDCTITRTYVATDECGNTASAVQTISVIDDTTAPIIEGSIEVDVACDADEVPVMVTVTDNCNEFELTYDDTPYGGGGCTANYKRFYTATDVCGNSSTFEQIITFIDEGEPVFDSFPEDVTVECGQIPSIDGLEIDYSDNCTSVMLEYSGEEIIEGDCPQSYTIERSWFLADACYNNTSATWTITVVDTTAPVFTSVPEDLELECGEEIPVTEATAEDGCGEVTVTYDDESDFGDCLETITRTFTATDECGNTTTAVQTIFIEDTTAPVFEGEIEVDWPCDEQYEVPVLVTVSDNCSEDIDLSWEDTMFGSAGCAGKVIRDFIAVDECGNSSTYFQSIQFVDYEAPEFTLFPEDITVDCNNIPDTEPEIAFTDNCSYEYPELLSFEGEVVVSEGCEYQIERTYSITDLCGNSTSAVWTITVADTTAPEFTSIPENLEIPCGEEIPVTEAIAEDNCGEVTVTYADESDFNGCQELISRTFTATDECGNSSSATQTISVVDTLAPVFTSIPEDLEIECDEELPVTEATAEDNCGDVSVTYADESEIDGCLEIITRTFTATDECDNTATAVQTISVEDTTAPEIVGEIEVDTPCDEEIPIMVTVSDNCSEEVDLSWDDIMLGTCAGRIIRSFTAVDECGNSSIFEQIITLVDEEAPAFTMFPEDVTVECDQIPSNDDLEIEYSDNCTFVTLEYSGEEIIEGNCPQSYTIERTWTLTDACDNSTSATWTITVQDTTAPVFTSIPEDLEIECSEELPETEAIAEDGCGDVIITYEDVVAEDACENGIIRTFTATDECGNASSATQTISVVDTIAPVFTSIPEDLEIECSEELPVTEATAEDNCGEVTVTSSDEVTDGDCTITRTFVATDECGNSTSAVQTITLIDEEAPEVECETTTVQITGEDDEAEVPDLLDGFSGSDNCSDSLTFEQTPASGTTLPLGSHTVTLTAYDDCGNATECEVNLDILTGIDEIFAGAIEIYPNPTTGLVEVVFPAIPSGKVFIEVYAVNGQLISHEKLIEKARYQIDLKNEPTGLYFLHIRTERGKVVKKLSRM